MNVFIVVYSIGLWMYQWFIKYGSTNGMSIDKEGEKEIKNEQNVVAELFTVRLLVSA